MDGLHGRGSSGIWHKGGQGLFLFFPFPFSLFFFFLFVLSVDFTLIFSCQADHVPDWQPHILLSIVETLSVNVRNKHANTHTHARV